MQLQDYLNYVYYNHKFFGNGIPDRDIIVPIGIIIFCKCRPSGDQVANHCNYIHNQLRLPVQFKFRSVQA